MTGTAFKDLCLDSADPARAAEFWAATLGLRAPTRDGGDLVLVDDVDEHRVWINRVEDLRTVKRRVYIDVHLAAVLEVTGRGARILDDSTSWTVLSDPEGGECCAFVRPAAEFPPYRFYELVIDAVEPKAIARDALDRCRRRVRQTTGTARLPAGPEPKTVKNCIHVDVWVRRRTW